MEEKLIGDKININGKDFCSVIKYERVMKVKVFSGNQPALDTELRGNTMMGLNRDRSPDYGWSQCRFSNMTDAREVELTKELKQILLEDLAYAFGNDTKKFNQKLKEFNLI